MHCAVIMAGGSGTRFWPASRSSFPKQLLSLAGGQSLLQETIARLAGLVEAERTFIVTGAAHAAALRAQVPELPPGNVLVEPCGRNTAPCVGLAALHVRRLAPGAIMVCLPADHAIRETAAWRRLLQAGFAEAARPGSVVTFGIPPTRPETGFGYVRYGPTATMRDGVPVHPVEAFTEKPELARAKQFLTEGRWFWNSGILIWRADTCLELIGRHLPETARLLAELDAAIGSAEYETVLARVYPRIPAISFDYGILEKTGGILGLPAPIGWNDVGSWSALPEVLPADAQGNVSVGRLIGHDLRGLVTYAPGKLVAALGVEDLVIVASGDAVMVCRKDRAQDVRKLVELLEREGLEKYR